LLDTNVVSELRKPRPHSKIIDFIARSIPRDTVHYRSYVGGNPIWHRTIGRCPAPRRPSSVAGAKFTAMFAGRVLTITEEVIVRWKTLVVEGRKRGRTFSQPDLFIAPIAVLEDLVVVSRDITECVEAAVPVFDPWAGALYFGGKKATLKGQKSRRAEPPYAALAGGSASTE
jgi:predicted nucleic acid-binding protein